MNMGKSHHLHRCTEKNCGEVFKKKSKLKNHLAKVHKTETAVKCSECDLIFDAPSKLNRHKKVHEGYKCEKCSSFFKTWSSMRKHHNSEHRLVVTKCGGCRKKFMSKEDLSNHYADCPKKENLTCKFCSRMFVRPMNVKIHIRTVHEKQRDFVCFVCNKAFLHAHNHANHLANCIVAQERGDVVKKQSSSDGVTCAGCGKYLFHKRSWWRHKKRCADLKQKSEKNDGDFSGLLGFDALLIQNESKETICPKWVGETVTENTEETSSAHESFVTVSEIESELDENHLSDNNSARASEVLTKSNQPLHTENERELKVPAVLKFSSKGVHKSRKFSLIGPTKRMRIYHSLVETFDQHQRFSE